MTDPLILQALRKLDEAAELLQLIGARAEQEQQATIDVPFLNQRLEQLDFGPGYTVRLRRMFENHRDLIGTDYVDAPLVTVRDLVALSEAEVLRHRDIGKQCLLRLKAMLAPHGLHFGMRDVSRLRSVA